MAQRALDLDKDFKLRNPNGAVTEKRIDALVQKRFHCQTVAKSSSAFPIPVHLGGRQYMCSRKSFSMLRCAEMWAIIRSVKDDRLTYKAAADVHGVKPSLVQSLMSKFKKDPDFTTKRRMKEFDKMYLKGHVVDLAG
jgi:hypothetical protein